MPSPVERFYRAVQRALRLILSPDKEWRAVASEPPESRSILASFVLPLACIPAAAWCFNLSVFGGEGGHDGERAAIGLSQVLSGGLTVWISSVLSILVLATSVYVLAPLFVHGRDWPGALKVAAFSAAPVLLGGAILAVPDVAYTILLPVFHSFYLQYSGLQHVLGVKEDSAAEYVALSIVLCAIASTALGALGGALGVL